MMDGSKRTIADIREDRRQRCVRAVGLRSEGLTYRRIGEAMGLSPERVRQILNTATRLDISA